MWGVSKDSAASHQRFREKFDLPFTLLSDPEREVIDRYGAWGEKTALGRTYMGIIRSTFLIDPDGRIVADLAEGQGGRPRRRGPRGSRRGASGPRVVTRNAS